MASDSVNFEAIPLGERKVYFATDIMMLLGLGKTKTYEFLNQVYKDKEPFRVIKVGSCVRIPKESFDKWFYDK